MPFTSVLHDVSDEVLLRRLGDLVRSSRRTECELVAHLGEVDARRLFARAAVPSMFAYCTHELHLSEAEAYLRIAAARAARRYPVLLALLEDGRLHLSAIARLAPHLTPANLEAVLRRAIHRSRREIEELVAEIAPRPDAPTLVRQLPAQCGSSTPAVPAPPDLATDPAVSHPMAAPREGPPAASWVAELVPDRVAKTGSTAPPYQPLSPGRVKVQFTASVAFRDKLERLQALMCSEVPDGDLATILDKAVSEKLERLEKRRFASVAASKQRLAAADTSPRSRHIPAAVRRAVAVRDGHRCRYLDEAGRRCPERHRLEYHHRYPFGRGGGHEPSNISLLCPAHNALMARADYGSGGWARPPSSSPQPPPRQAASTR